MEPFAGANALPCGARIKISLLAKDDVNNVGAGRAAKGANPVVRTKKSCDFVSKSQLFPMKFMPNGKSEIIGL